MGKSLSTKCFGCRGAVIYDKFYGSQEQFIEWKCLICGEIVDPVILENRQLMKAGQGINVRRTKREKRGYELDFWSRQIQPGLLAFLQGRDIL